MASFTFQSIGTFHGPRSTKSSLPRQGSLSSQAGHIVFASGFDHKTALSGLEEMSHIWLIFVFHEAKSPAKPLVRPPRAPDQQIGVYATRSPYRPNSIGLTLAQVDRLEEGKLFLKSVDLLDGTPILDLKPYVINKCVG
ncbi:MAG: tRNA (N6-threonylcarbamoyladenosine(37)-N6)-methyltransferase TrmO [Bdellovibrionales bacterium]